jgi:hypothetical protein
MKMDNTEASDDMEKWEDREDDQDDPIFNHPLVHLGMGLIEACTLIVPKASVPTWTAEGWAELPGYFDFLYAAEEDEMVIARRPDTLTARGASELVGAQIAGWCNILGSYGMGGPGFFGLLLPPRAGAAYREYLVFAAWGADQYVLLDGRVLDAAPRYRDQYGPWLAGGDEGRAALDAALIGASIEAAEVADDHLRMTLSHRGRAHVLEYLRHDPRLPPMGGGGPREPAYEEGTIADYLVFQPESAVLWV